MRDERRGLLKQRFLGENRGPIGLNTFLVVTDRHLQLPSRKAQVASPVAAFLGSHDRLRLRLHHPIHFNSVVSASSKLEL